MRAYALTTVLSDLTEHIQIQQNTSGKAPGKLGEIDACY